MSPLRLTGSGAAKPAQVKRAAFLSLVSRLLAGAVLVVLSQQWWFAIVGSSCSLRRVGLHRRKEALRLLGPGRVSVRVSIGPWPLWAPRSTQAGRAERGRLDLAISTGLFACALLMANNVRDIPGDHEVGRKTLAVRLGDAKGPF